MFAAIAQVFLLHVALPARTIVISVKRNCYVYVLYMFINIFNADLNVVQKTSDLLFLRFHKCVYLFKILPITNKNGARILPFNLKPTVRNYFTKNL